MQEKYGMKKVDEMIRNKSIIHKIQTPQLLELINLYKKKALELSKEKEILDYN